ncbi:hypothetical protein A8926_6655 [Saccharopolyspora spinosa]|uniref:Uncharacterized protein n=1 Tax=Saccharopolyspora spinosa TaxID=60894 RepID=A0A2N3Y6J7_SACSN|nr:hypothetical protein A8926_6655 [Saccharopolyspora spinosa]
MSHSITKAAVVTTAVLTITLIAGCNPADNSPPPPSASIPPPASAPATQGQP